MVRILVLSIAPSTDGNRQRSDYLADALEGLGHDVYRARWTRWKDRREQRQQNSPERSIRLLPTASRVFRERVPHWNALIARVYLRRIVRQWSIELVIWPNNWYLIGYPPVHFPARIAIDYFDLLDSRMERKYFIENRLVFCGSQELTERAKQLTKNAHWIPTPIELERFQISPQQAKVSIGLPTTTKVISLIGLTAAKSLYFMDAVDRLPDGDLVCMMVGGGELLRLAKSKLSTLKHPDRFIFKGKVPYSDIPAYFAASDIGLYPGEDSDYFHAACPIKVLEYTAAGVTVVANDLRELRRWAFSNVMLVSPTADAFENALDTLIKKPTWTGEPSATVDLEAFSTTSVGGRLAAVVTGGD